MSAVESAATLLAQTVRMSVPYVCAAMAGVWSERSGVVNIALEGMLLASALGAVAVSHATGSPWAGVVGAAAVGGVFGLAHGLVTRARVDAILSGVALNLVALGGTRFLLRAMYDSSSNSPPVAGFRVAGLGGSSGEMLLVRTLVDPLTLLAVLVTMATAFALGKTRFGLRVRACGEDPVAAAAVGVPVWSVRVRAVVLGGCVCGIGGAGLAYDQHQFGSGMSGGRGFIALAAVIVGGWLPGRAALACVAFAAVESLQIVLQEQTRSAHDLVSALPYVATLAALAAIGRRRGETAGHVGMRPPAALGKGFEV